MSLEIDSVHSEFNFPDFLFHDNLFSQNNFFRTLNNNFFVEEEEKPTEEIQIKQPIKFVLTKSDSPSFLQKKTSFQKNNQGCRWSTDEQKKFAEAVLKYGIDWKRIQEHVATRNLTQIRSHAQKFLVKLKENELLINKGLDLQASWNKVIIFMFKKLSHEEIKDILFSVEGRERKNFKKGKKKDKTVKIIEIDEESENYLPENEKTKKNEIKENEELLENFIKCFNPAPTNDILNISFEEEEEEEKNYSGNFLDFKNEFDKNEFKYENFDDIYRV